MSIGYNSEFVRKSSIFLILCFLVLNAKAQKPKQNLGFEIIPNEDVPSEIRGNMRVNSVTGFPIAMYAVNYPVTPKTNPESQALEFLQHFRGQLGLAHSDLSDLVFKAKRTSASGTVVRFNQMAGGFQVYGSEITISIDNEDKVQFVMSSYKTGIENLPAQSITAKTARDLALDYLNLQGPYSTDKTTTVVYQLEGQTYLCHRVQLVGHNPYGDWEVLVDASNGNLLKVADVALYCHPHHNNTQDETDECEPQPSLPPPPPSTGTGFVYDADPLSSAGVAYAGAYVDGSDATNASLDAQRTSKTLPDIDLTSGTYSLRGPYAYIIDFEAPNKGLFTQASSTFNFNRNQDAFEAVNTYYFIDMSMRYLNNTLGVTVMPYQYTTGVQYDPSGLNGADNSHYISSSGRLAFGEGGVDDAEDTDVILHELGHGLHDWITTGGLSNNQGLSEGTGDYWTQSHSRSLGQWTTAQPAYHWVFNWDGHNPFWGGRTTNYTALYPGGLTGAIHTDGQIWSSCMMKIYDQIGRSLSDRALWEGLNLTNGSSNQNDAAIAVRQAAINMGYSSANISTISTLLAGCGYTLPALPLPLHTVAFDAERINPQEVALTWTTENACEISSFTIERKTGNETGFKPIGTVGGSSSCNVVNFSWSDFNTSPNTSWYRIRETDANGNQSYTEVRAVSGNVNGPMEVVIYPQPVKDVLQFWVKVENNNLQQLSLRITTANGSEVMTKSIDLNGISTHVELPEISGLAAGLYFLEVNDGEHAAVQKFTLIR